MKLLERKQNCPYENVTCENWECEECEIYHTERNMGNKIFENINTRPEQIRAGADKTINKLVDYLLKENKELKEENKQLKKDLKNTKEEYNKMFIAQYGIYPGDDE